MNKKGFTLVELLAVIVIISIIALIATPMILGVLENSRKKALEGTAIGLLEAADVYFKEIQLDSPTSVLDIDLNNIDLVGYNGELPEELEIHLNDDGDRSILAVKGKWCAYKKVEDQTIKVVSKNDSECRLT